MHAKFILKKSILKFLLIIFIFLFIKPIVVLASPSDTTNLNTLNQKIEQLEKENKSLREDLNKITKDKLAESYKDQNESILKSTDLAIKNITILISVVAIIITIITAIGTIAIPLIASKKEEARFEDIKDKIFKIEESLDLKIQQINNNLDDKTSLSNNSFKDLEKKLNLLKQDVTELLNNASQSATKAHAAAQKAKKSENIAQSYALANEATKLYENKKYNSALEKFNQSLELNPNDSYILTNRGCLYDAIGKYDLALKDYNSALNINSNDITIINNRASLYRKMGNLDLAYNEIAVALNLNENDPYSLATSAEIALSKNDKEEFYKNIEKSLKNGFPLNDIYKDNIYREVLNESRFKELLEKYKNNK